MKISQLINILYAELIRRIKLKRSALLLIHSKADDVPEKKEHIKYLRKHFFQHKSLRVIFPSPFVEKYLKMRPDFILDEEAGLYYTIFKGKRLYWKEGVNFRAMRSSFIRLLAEQDPSSPHKYFDDDFNFENKVLYDAGAAEGIIVLEHIEKIKHAYLFECDEGWEKALTYTFKPYSNKITIISKYVSDHSSAKEISFDDFMEETDVIPDIIKLDIEGYEERALEGGIKMLTAYHPFVSCCLYHLPDAEKNILSKFSAIGGYHCQVNPFYMYCIGSNTGVPYLRHGIVRAHKMINENENYN